MALRTGYLRPADAPVLAAWIQREQPVSPTLAPALATLIATGISDGSLVAVGTELQESPELPWTLDAFGIVGFLSNRAVDRYAQTPAPFLALTLFEHALQDGAATWFLDRDGIAIANAGEGLHMFIFFWFQSTHGYASVHSHRLLETAYRLGTTALSGFNLRSVTLQGRTENEAAFLAGGFTKVDVIPCTAEHVRAGYSGCGRLHARMTAAEAHALLPGSQVRNLFIFERPTLRLTQDQQAVIELALADLADDAIAEHLGIQLSAVQKRWQRVYDKIADYSPAVFNGLQLSESAVRGPEKRRSVVAYVRMHPQELRPFHWGN